MNLLLIGPSGIGKSTALRDMAVNWLIQPLPDNAMKPNVLSGKMTKEALHQDLMVQPKSIIMASELANLFSKEKYQEGMLPYVTDLLDLAPTRIRTKGDNSQVIQRPECCIVGGSTKAWLQDMLPNTAGEGGFLPRFLIVKEDYKAQRVANPRKHMSEKQRSALDQHRTVMQYEFHRLMRMSEGPVDFEDYDASDTYEYWYQTYQPDTGALAPFAARAGAHILRMALLLAVSCGRDSIRVDDVLCAIQLYMYTATKLQEVIVPMSPQGKLLMKVLDIIGEQGMSDVQIRRAMRNHCGADDTDRIINNLLKSKEIRIADGIFHRTSV
jgi:hypothetical protein